MRYRRVHEAGHSYFFTLVTHDRQHLLTLPQNLGRLRSAFKIVKARLPFDMEAVVVLPDHLHALWRLPENDSDYSSRWSQIKRHFSTGCVGAADEKQTASRISKRERPVWQRRFWEHTIRDERDWQAHLDYIHFNPVKHGYAARVSDWAHSSFQRCVTKGWYEPEWGDVQPEHIRDMDLE